MEDEAQRFSKRWYPRRHNP